MKTNLLRDILLTEDIDSIVQILLENIKDFINKQIKDGSITQEEVNTLKNKIESKYLMWSIKQYIVDNKILDELTELLKSFDVYVKQGKISETDITSYKTLKDLKDEIHLAKTKVSGMEKRAQMKYGEGLIEGKDYDIVKDNNKYILVTPLTHAASAYFGKDTKWCTSEFNNDSHWVGYTKKNIKFYYLLVKNSGTGYDNQKFAFAVSPEYK